MPFNNDQFLTLAGNREPWASEHAALPRGCGSDALCALQVAQSDRGYRPAELVRTIYGWSIRYASGLQGHDLLYRGRGLTRDAVVAWGVAWANADPTHREFYARRSDLDDRHVPNSIPIETAGTPAQYHD